MKVHRPSKNKLTQGYYENHRGYDFSGIGDTNAYADLDLKVIQSVDKYVSNWKSSPPLTTRDYGNYFKCVHNDGTYSLYAHLERNTVPKVGQTFKKGQVVSVIGNTGNSTGRHLHYEFRNANNINQPVTWEDEMSDDALSECLKLHGQLVDENLRLKKELQEKKESINKMESELKKEISDLQINLKSQTVEAEEQRKELKELVAWLAQNYNVTQEIPRIKAEAQRTVLFEDELVKVRKELEKRNSRIVELERLIESINNGADDADNQHKIIKSLDEYEYLQLLEALFKKVLKTMKARKS